MSLMDIINGFRGAPAPNTAAGQNTTVDVTGNKTVPGSEVGNTGTVTPGGIQPPAKGDESPLHNYKDLWQVDTKAITPVSMTPNIQIDNAKIMEAAKTIDFTKAFSPADLAKASKGDETALATILNQAAQAGYGQAAAMTLTVVKQALTEQENTFTTKVMPEILRKHSISSSVSSANESLINNPAAAPLLKVLEAQFAAKYSGASAAEITKHAETYLAGFADEVIKANGGTVVKKDDKNSAQMGSMRNTDPDWEALLIGSTA